MLPSTWVGVVLFLVLIGPGALFDLLSDRRRAHPKETALREASRIVLASLCFSGLGFAVLAAAGSMDARWAPDLGALLRDPHGYALERYPLLIWSAAVEFAVACAAAGGFHYLLRWRQKTSMRTVSLWHAAFHEDAPKGDFLPYVRVRLTNGAVWTGYVAHASTDLELADRELVLSAPLWCKLKDDAALAPVPAEWSRVVFPGSVVENIAVSYRPKAGARTGAGSPPASSPADTPLVASGSSAPGQPASGAGTAP